MSSTADGKGRACMDADDFDSLARPLSASGTRRQAVVATFSGMCGLFSQQRGAHAGAGRGCKEACWVCHRCKKGTCKNAKHGTRCKHGRCKRMVDGAACVNGTCLFVNGTATT